MVGVHFQYASFDAILQHGVPRLGQLPQLRYLSFDSTALSSLGQLYALLLKLRKISR